MVVAEGGCTKEERKLLAESVRVLEYARKVRMVIDSFVGTELCKDSGRPEISNPIVEATYNIEEAQKEITEAIVTFENQVIKKVK